MKTEDFYKQFCEESFDENGVLNPFKPVYKDNFNFAYDCVDALAQMEPDRKALLWTNDKGEERTFTFRDISLLSNQAANMFLKYGIEKGDRVMLVLKRHYQFWIAMMGLCKIGAIAVPATNLLMEKDYVYRFEAAGVKAIVATAEGGVEDRIDHAEEESGPLGAKFLVHGKKEGWLDFDEEVASASDQLIRQETYAGEGMLLYFSSGTTGNPKMALHDYTYAIAHIITARHWHNVETNGLHLTVAETGWGKAVWGKLYGQWFCGTTVFVYDYADKFVPEDLMEMIRKYKVTSFCAPPTVYRFLVKNGLENYDLSSLKYATTAGEALNPEVFNRFQEQTGLDIMEGFGQTETTLVLANLVNSKVKVGSMGRLSPLYDAGVFDENGKEVPRGKVGEICIRAERGKTTPGLFIGYYRDELRTAEAWHDGLYHTGDTAWMDEEGYFWYVGRTDDVIKASGYRIGPFEVESALMQHPAVMECAVTGAPDPVRGQVVKATVVLTKAYTASDALTKELQDFVKKTTAPYKYPRIIEYVEFLPKTISGKIMRKDIRAADKNRQVVDG